MIDENKLLDELEETFTDEFLHEKKFCLARYSFMDLLKEMINELTKVDCGNCSRRKFYQKGYQEGLNANKWIPCSSGKLPENYETVNITWVNRNPEPYYEHIKDKPFTGTAVFYYGEWYWYSCICEDYLKECGDSTCDRMDRDIEVLAWMPLPEPYRGDEE